VNLNLDKQIFKLIKVPTKELMVDATVKDRGLIFSHLKAQ
jgi:hypothetical protein